MQVFMSYAYADKEIAQRIAQYLRVSGFEVWDPATDLLPGDNWGDALGNALRHSQAMVVLFTPRSIDSPNVEKEASYALGDKEFAGRVVPVLADGITLSDIPWVFRLKVFHSIELGGPYPSQEQLHAIARALGPQLASAGG